MKTPALFKKRHNVEYDEIIEACKVGPTMYLASVSLNVPYKTFIRIAKKIGCYQPNQGAKGTNKTNIGQAFPLEEILAGKYPQYPTSKLRKRLIASGLKRAACEICGISSWNGSPAPLELDHIDGNNSNHALQNLRIICPNCHALTPTHSCKVRNRKME
jgi:hypothetical protein